MTYYEILEVSELASPETIQAAYRSLSKRYHPDNKKTGNVERFKIINEANETLVSKRVEYDEALRAEREVKARPQTQYRPPVVENYDPQPGVSALFTIAHAAMEEYGVHPLATQVMTHLQPDLEKIAAGYLKRILA